MKLPTTALLSVIMAVTAVSTVVGPTFKAEIINFPLDEAGNLSVTNGVASKVVTLATDLSMVGYEEFVVTVDGFNELVVYASFKEWNYPTLQYTVDVDFMVDGIVTDASIAQVEGISGTVDAYTLPLNASALYHIRGPEAIIKVWAFSAVPPFPSASLQVSLSLYLRG